MSTPVT